MAARSWKFESSSGHHKLVSLNNLWLSSSVTIMQGMIAILKLIKPSFLPENILHSGESHTLRPDGIRTSCLSACRLRQTTCSPNRAGFLLANHPMIFAEIRRQNDTSSASNSSPRGSIHSPSTGRNDRTPPAQNRRPEGTLIHHRDGSSSQ